MGKGGGGDQVVYQKAEPWEGAQDLAQLVMDEVQNKLVPEWMNNPFMNGYDGQTLADFNQQQLDAMEQTQQWASDPSKIDPLFNAANRMLDPSRMQTADDAMYKTWNSTINPALEGRHLNWDNKSKAGNLYADTMNGKYLNANPYRDAAISAATRPMAEAMDRGLLSKNAEAVASGRYGSRLWNEGRNDLISDTQRNMGDVSSRMANEQYNFERGMQQNSAQQAYNDWHFERQQQANAANFAPMIQDITTKQYALGNTNYQGALNQQYKQLGILQSLGDQQYQMDQAKLDDAYRKAAEGFWMPYNAAASIGNLAFTGGQMGGMTQTTQPSYAPTLAQSLMGGAGIGAGAYGLANSMGFGQYAPYIGLISGGLGMFG